MSELLKNLIEMDREAESLLSKGKTLEYQVECLAKIRLSETQCNIANIHSQMNSVHVATTHKAAYKRVTEHIDKMLPDILRVVELEMQAAARKYKMQGLVKKASIRASIQPVEEAR